MTGMVDVLATAVEVHRLCERRGWEFCLIGGIAVQRWGNPRFTVDVDLTLLTGYGSEERFVDGDGLSFTSARAVDVDLLRCGRVPVTWSTQRTTCSR